MALAPLRQFGIRSVLTTTLQAVSGAGYPGVPSFDILGNVIPGIGGGEEEKIETEANKILGTFEDGRVTAHPAVVSAHTNRVPVIDGHTMTVSVGVRPDARAPRRSRPPCGVARPSAGARGCRARPPDRSRCWPKASVRSRGSTRCGATA